MIQKIEEKRRVDKDYIIFFVFMTLMFALMFAWTLVENSSFRESWLIIPTTIIFIVHIVAHWNVEYLCSSRPSKLLYIIVQGILAFIIVALTKNIGMLMVLYMGLLGESIGVFSIKNFGVFSILYNVILAVISFLYINSSFESLSILLGMIPIAFFVGLFVILYNRQNLGREEAEKLAKDLREANANLLKYADEIEDLTIANERSRMAREVHDTLSQGLAGIILKLEASDAYLNKNRNDKAQEIIQKAMEQSRAMLSSVRKSISSLRTIKTESIQTQITEIIEEFKANTGIVCNINLSLLNTVQVEANEAILGLISEGLSNIIKHAKATKVAITLLEDQDVFKLQVSDNGIGFNPVNIPLGHFGLIGIKERAALIDAKLNIESRKGKGTCLTLLILKNGTSK